jgi:hypothetical protein
MDADDKPQRQAAEPEEMAKKITERLGTATGRQPEVTVRDVEIARRHEPESKAETNKKERDYKTKYSNK